MPVHSHDWSDTGQIVNKTGLNFVEGEKPTGSVSGLNTQYTLAHTPITGSVRTFIAGLRLDPSNASVSGTVVTIATALVGGGLVMFDYRWGT